MDLSGITRAGLVLPVKADPTGVNGPRWREAAGPHWRSPYRGWHVPAGVDGTHPEQRIVEAAAVLPSSGAVTGWAALCWAGGRYFDGTTHGGSTLLPVSLALDNRRRLRQHPGIELCEEFLDPDDVVVMDGLPVTVPSRSVCRLLRLAPRLEDRVQILDMAAFHDLCSPTEVETYARTRLGGRPHVTRIWQAIPWASENSWSPMEPVMRMTWLQARRVPLLVNAPLFDEAGRHLITPDLIDPIAGVVGEYDGAPHRGTEPRERDLDREETYRRLGLELVTMMSADLSGRERFVRRLASAYQRAAARRVGGGWTLIPPDWWIDTSTVARRRALSDREREVWLRRRRVARRT
jgi:hypothetical protein